MRMATLLVVIALSVVACSSQSDNPPFEFTVVTLTDTDGEAIRFDRPEGIAVDAEGNLYVAELLGGIQRVSPRGEVSTILDDDDVALPSKLTLDSAGTIYVTESGKNRILRIEQSGHVTVVAGTGEMGYVDGEATQAQFFLPLGIAVDATGNVYVADSGNNRIRRISPQGEVSTPAGSERGFADGPGAAARFTGIAGVALDTTGKLYVAEANGERIRVITREGLVSTLAGSGEIGFEDGPALDARFNGPTDIAIDGRGNIYIADLGNHSIRIITPEGRVETIAGNGEAGYVDGEGAEAQFMFPQAVAVDESGTIYVADSGNGVIRVLRPTPAE